jgi:hypothetical protein
MLTMRLSDWGDVRTARDLAGALARAAGVTDPQMLELAVGELSNNCLEHRDGPGAAVLRMGCRRGRLVVQAANPCRRRPTWQTSKPVAVEAFREGGYGLLLVRSVAREVRTGWHQGRAGVRAEFASGRTPVNQGSARWGRRLKTRAIAERARGPHQRRVRQDALRRDQGPAEGPEGRVPGAVSDRQLAA